MNNEKILVVDDEPDICSQFSLYFSRKGLHVLTATNGADALKIFNQQSPAIVITDYQMPGMNGLELLKKIKQINPQAQVIFISGHADMKIAVEAIREQAFDFVPKPIDFEEIETKMASALERSLNNYREMENWRGGALSFETLENQATVIHVRTNLDEYSKQRIQRDLMILLQDNKLREFVILSLNEVGYINNVGLNLLVDMVKDLEKQNRRVILASPSPTVLSYLRNLGYHEYFRIVLTLEKARLMVRTGQPG